MSFQGKAQNSGNLAWEIAFRVAIRATLPEMELILGSGTVGPEKGPKQPQLDSAGPKIFYLPIIPLPGCNGPGRRLPRSGLVPFSLLLGGLWRAPVIWANLEPT